MKKKTVLIFLPIFLTVLATADPYDYRNSRLSIQSYDNTQMVLVMDNHPVQHPSAQIVVDRIAPGRHHVRLIRQLPTYYDGVPAQQTAYEGFIAIPPSTMVRMVLVNRKLRLIDQHPLYTGEYFDNDWDDEEEHSNYGHGYVFPTMIYQEPLNILGDNCDHNPNTCNNGAYPGSYGMNDAAFNYLISSMNNVSFDKSRLEIAEQAIEMNGCTASQVLALMHMLDFESSRLKLAKFAWHYVGDRQNYFVVNDGFTFSSSIRQLNQYITHH